MSVTQLDTLSVNVLHVKGDVDLNSLRPRNAVILQGSPGSAGQSITSQGPGKAPYWAGGGSVTTVPIGGMIMSIVALSDPNWLLCNGGTFSAATYPALNTLLGGNTLPDMRNLSPMGAASTVGLGSTAGALTSTGLVAHVHGSGGGHTHTSAAHVHGSGGPHSHSHNHGPSAGSAFVVQTGGSGNIPAGGAYNAQSNTDTDATATDPGNTASTTPAATGNTDPGNTASAGSGSSFSILSPVIGVNFYIRAA